LHNSKCPKVSQEGFCKEFFQSQYLDLTGKQSRNHQSGKQLANVI